MINLAAADAGSSFNMAAEHRKLKWILMLQFLGGVLCSAWNVKYPQQRICAVRGSSVVIFCTFSYPSQETVQSVKWGHERQDLYHGPFIYDSDLNNASSRFLYIGDKGQNCSLKILNVDPNDIGKYAFRFVTSGTKREQFTGADGPILHIFDLRIDVRKQTRSNIVKEGDSLNLTCINSCDGGTFSSAFTWYKDGEPFYEGPAIYFINMSSINSGNYSCSLKGHNWTNSELVHIDVGYGPMNTSASATTSEEVDAGSNVTLICSSHANPPVENFTWFKMHNKRATAVGHHPEYHFKELFQIEGQYFCTATNKHGSQNSSVVTLKLKENWTTKYRNILIIAASFVMLLIVTAVVTIRRGCNKRTTCSKSKGDVDPQNAEYVNWPMSDTGRAQKKSRCEPEVIYAIVVTRRKSDMVQQTDTHDDEECVIYSTVCRAQT